MSDARANAAVAQAVRDGLLPPVTTQRCVDCGAVATAYDHHAGYARENWLAVQPVCTRHNALRSKSRPAWDAGLTDPVSVLMRVPRYLLDALSSESQREGRSRNQQLNWILKQRYPNATLPSGDVEGEESNDRHVRESREHYWRAA